MRREATINTQSGRDERGRDLLGFLEELCPHCGARLFLAADADARPICLNACELPAWAYRLLLRGPGETREPQ